MCLNCGCNEPDKRHSDERNITMRDLVNAAKANQSNVGDQARNISTTVKKVMDGSLMSAACKSPARKPAKRSRTGGARAPSPTR
jgi:hypothetical protein